jgi:K+-transporting ATPase KdpF subunit
MSFLYLAALALTVGLLVYLCVALLKPEYFS